MPHLDALAMQAIAARPCFIEKVQSRSASRQLLYQLADVIGTIGNRSPVADLAATNRRLVDIKPDERAILHVVSPLFLRLGTRQPGAILERKMPREGPPTQSAHTAIMGSKLLANPMGHSRPGTIKPA
ncbi:MAG: hypothetical protein ACK4GC_04260 [Paracoccaceae bacterium]